MISLLYFILLLVNSVYSSAQQPDTMQLKEVVIGYKKVEKTGYKTIEADSITLQLHKNYTLAELLTRETGVFIKNYGPGALALPSFRGTAAGHTKTFWNGLPLTSPMLGVADLALLPVFALDDVELQFGSAGLKRSSGGFGGVINLGSGKRNTGNIFEADLSQNIGSFGSKQTQFNANYGSKFWGATRFYQTSAENNFTYRNLAKFNTPVEEQKFAGLKQYGIMQTAGVDFGSKSSLQTAIWYQQTGRSLPPLMTTANQNEFQHDEALRATMKFNTRHSDSWSTTVEGGYSYELLQYENQFSDIHSRSIFQRAYIYPRINYSKSEKLSSEAGVQYFYDNTISPKYKKQQQRVSAPLQLDYSPMSRWLFTIILRPELVENQEPVVSASASAAVNIFKKEQLQFYVNGGKNYNFPTLNDLYWWPGGNPDLEPENAILTEAGAKSSITFLQDKLKLHHSINVFSNWIDNYIQWMPSGAYWKPGNLKEVWSRGFEASAQWKYSYKKQFVQLNSGYSFVRSTNMKALNSFDNSVGKQLIYVPQHQAQSTLNLGWGKSIFSAQYIYTHYRYTPTNYLPAYALLHLSAGSGFSYKKFDARLMLKCNNVLNTEYQSVEWRPMPGRWYEASVSINFKQPKL